MPYMNFPDYDDTYRQYWITYFHKLHPNASDRTKVHISIQHDEDTIENAQALILPILAKHNIQLFKTANPLHPPSVNMDGKEFCIYIQAQDTNSVESNSTFWITLLNEIETILEREHIPKSPKGALGDLLFPGSKGYVYYRHAYDIDNKYVEAALLMKCGFTRMEACNISTNDFFKGHFLSQGNVRLADIARLPLLQIELSDELEGNKEQIKAIHDVLNTQRDSALSDDLFRKNLRKFKGNEFYLFHYNCLMTMLPEYFDKAAEKIAKIAILLERNGYSFDSTKLGSILPALYFHFFIPLHKEYFSQFPPRPELSEAASKRLVNAIVRCALRDTTKTAIDYEGPQYIHHMTEEDVSKLLSLIDKQSTAIESLIPQDDEEVISAYSSSKPNPVTSFVDDLSRTIDDILNQFEEDIAGVGIHHENTKPTLSRLLQTLRQKKELAFRNPTPQLLNNFALDVKDAIKVVTPELQRDLGWGDYLTNLAKTIVNAITQFFAYIKNLGPSNHQGFFTLKSSEAVQKAENLKNSINDALTPKS